MLENYTLTSYAPATRFNNGQLENQSGVILRNHQLVSFVESISQMVLILNEYRQIIYANRSFYQFCETNNIDSMIGKRPGEVYSCRNAFQSSGGCGTSENCKSCGAVNAILESQKGIKSTKECKILTTNSDTIDLNVMASPLSLDGINLTIFSITDISAEKRKESLERVFIHDILNSAGGISGLSAILKEIDDKEEIKDIASTIEGAANGLIEEIKVQREFGAAERGDLHPQFDWIESMHIINEVQKLYKNHDLNFGKPILIDEKAENVSVKTDRVLLKRILGNMVKNAIEVHAPNDEITINCTKLHDSVCFSVHNDSVIPTKVQAELFKRLYSTKGTGRGMGTYSMKLFGEKYLKGEVWFESSNEAGTTFFIKLK
jgi:signal transduction histidine kinase